MGGCGVTRCREGLWPSRRCLLAVVDSDFVARSRTLAKLALATAAILVFLVLLLVLVVDHTTVSGAFLLLWGTFLLLSATILGVALAYVFMTRGMREKERAPNAERREGVRTEPGGTPSGESPAVPGPPPPEVALRLLSGDERRLYWKIVQAGGAVLQKNLVGEGLFSGPKVTRILDRLEAKGLIDRERYGMTNRIRISERWRDKL